jgi:hypothetical protein
MDSEKATGLREVEISAESGELDEWQRDKLLVELTIRLNRISKGVFSTYGRYLIPLSIAFPLCGILIFVAFRYSQKKLPIGFLYFGDLLLVMGIFLVILLVFLLAFDWFRMRYFESLTGGDMKQYSCVHYGNLPDTSGEHPACTYFNRTFDDSPLCLVCPIYQFQKNSNE